MSANCRGRLIGKMSSSLAFVARVTSAVLVPGAQSHPPMWPARGTQGWMCKSLSFLQTQPRRSGCGERRPKPGHARFGSPALPEGVGRRGGDSGWDTAGEG